MIGRFELCQAARDHRQHMTDIAAQLKQLDINPDELALLANSLREARDPKSAKSKKAAYAGGFMDGFVLGVKSQIAEFFVQCERCGCAVARTEEHDPVPDDYSPLEHKLICGDCMPAANAHLN